MNLTIRQPDTEFASHKVTIKFSGGAVVHLPKGGEIHVRLTNEPCWIEAICGEFKARHLCTQSMTLLIQWTLSPPQMILTRKGNSI